MNHKSLLPAILTGSFCAVFAIVISMLGSIFSVVPGLLIAFTSGFLGSLFATFILKKDRT